MATSSIVAMRTSPFYRFLYALSVAASLIGACALQANASVDRSHLYPAALVSAPPAFDPSLADPAWSSAALLHR